MADFLGNKLVSLQRIGSTRFFLVKKDLVGYKAVRKERKFHGWPGDPVTIELLIPQGAVVYVRQDFMEADSVDNNRVTRKLRASMAIVSDTKGEKGLRSSYDNRFKYNKGDFLWPEHFSLISASCEGGIHFFLDEEDADRYLN